MADENYAAPKANELDRISSKPIKPFAFIRSKLNKHNISNKKSTSVFSRVDPNKDTLPLYRQELDVAQTVLPTPRQTIPQYAAMLGRRKQFNYALTRRELRSLIPVDKSLSTAIADGTKTQDELSGTAAVRTTAALGQLQFDTTVRMNYMRKNLALSYQMVSLTRSMVGLTTTIGSVLEDKLEAIKLNTAAPDGAKSTGMEKFFAEIGMQNRRQYASRVVDAMNSVTNWALRPINTRIEKVRSGEKSFTDIVNDLKTDLSKRAELYNARWNPEEGQKPLGYSAPPKNGFEKFMRSAAKTYMPFASKVVDKTSRFVNNSKRLPRMGKKLDEIANYIKVNMPDMGFFHPLTHDDSIFSTATDLYGNPIALPGDSSGSPAKGAYSTQAGMLSMLFKDWTSIYRINERDKQHYLDSILVQLGGDSQKKFLLGRRTREEKALRKEALKRASDNGASPTPASAVANTPKSKRQQKRAQASAMKEADGTIADIIKGLDPSKIGLSADMVDSLKEMYGDPTEARKRLSKKFSALKKVGRRKFFKGFRSASAKLGIDDETTQGYIDKLNEYEKEVDKHFSNATGAGAEKYQEAKARIEELRNSIAERKQTVQSYLKDKTAVDIKDDAKAKLREHYEKQLEEAKKRFETLKSQFDETEKLSEEQKEKIREIKKIAEEKVKQAQTVLNDFKDKHADTADYIKDLSRRLKNKETREEATEELKKKAGEIYGKIPKTREEATEVLKTHYESLRDVAKEKASSIGGKLFGNEQAESESERDGLLRRMIEKLDSINTGIGNVAKESTGIKDFAKKSWERVKSPRANSFEDQTENGDGNGGRRLTGVERKMMEDPTYRRGLPGLLLKALLGTGKTAYRVGAAGVEGGAQILGGGFKGSSPSDKLSTMLDGFALGRFITSRARVARPVKTLFNIAGNTALFGGKLAKIGAKGAFLGSKLGFKGARFGLGVGRKALFDAGLIGNTTLREKLGTAARLGGRFARSGVGIALAGMGTEYLTNHYTTKGSFTNKLGHFASDTLKYGGTISLLFGPEIGIPAGMAMAVLTEHAGGLGNAMAAATHGVGSVVGGMVHGIFGQSAKFDKNGKLVVPERGNFLTQTKDFFFGNNAKYDKHGRLIKPSSKSLMGKIGDGLTATFIGKRYSNGERIQGSSFLEMGIKSLRNTIGAIPGIIKSIPKKIEALFTDAKTRLSKMWDDVKGTASKAASATKRFAKKAYNTVKNKLKHATVTEILKGTAHAVVHPLDTATRSVEFGIHLATNAGSGFAGWMAGNDLIVNNPTYQKYLKARMEAYGVTDPKVFGYVVSLENIQSRIAAGITKPFSGDDFDAIAEKFGFDPANKDGVAYIKGWYISRFAPLVKVFEDALKGIHKTHDDIYSLTDDDVTHLLDATKKARVDAKTAFKNLEPSVQKYKENAGIIAKPPEGISPQDVKAPKPWDPRDQKNSSTKPGGPLDKAANSNNPANPLITPAQISAPSPSSPGAPPAVAAATMGDVTQDPNYKTAFYYLTPKLQERVGKSKALQFVLWSTAVQGGPAAAAKIFKNEYDGNEDDATFIRKIYQDRSTKFEYSSYSDRMEAIGQLYNEQSFAQNIESGSIKPTSADMSAVVGKPIAMNGDDTLPDDGGDVPPQPLPPAERQKRAMVAMKYFMSQGWSAIEAAGMVANIDVESRFDPHALGDGNHAKGLGQWHGDRRENILKGLFQGKKKWSELTFEDQLAAYSWELRNTEKGAGKKLAGAKSPEEAGSIVSKFFERPADVTGNMKVRAGLAKSMYALYQKTQGAADTQEASAGASAPSALTPPSTAPQGSDSSGTTAAPVAPATAANSNTPASGGASSSGGDSPAATATAKAAMASVDLHKQMVQHLSTIANQGIPVTPSKESAQAADTTNMHLENISKTLTDQASASPSTPGGNTSIMFNSSNHQSATSDPNDLLSDIDLSKKGSRTG